VPVLVTRAELKTYLGDAPASADDLLLDAIIDDVEALFASETGRAISSFIASGTGRIEVLDGSDSRDLFVDYPITALTSVTLGYTASAWDETLAVADKNVLVYAVGGRKISRTDGGTWGRFGRSRYVTVTYDYAADLATSAKLAIKSVAAQAYRRRGSEDVKSETFGSFYSHTMVGDVAADDPYWPKAVAANARGQLV
jgi:hypothetical protein